MTLRTDMVLKTTRLRPTDYRGLGIGPTASTLPFPSREGRQFTNSKHLILLFSSGEGS